MAYQIQIAPLVSDSPNVGIGVQIPFVSKGGVLFDISYSTLQQVISNLKNLILTRKGERVNQPTFGTDIYKSVFQPNNDSLIPDIRNTIEQAIGFWLPYVTIDRLIITPALAVRTYENEYAVKIQLDVSVNGQQANQTLTFLASQAALEIVQQ